MIAVVLTLQVNNGHDYCYEKNTGHGEDQSCQLMRLAAAC